MIAPTTPATKSTSPAAVFRSLIPFATPVAADSPYQEPPENTTACTIFASYESMSAAAFTSPEAPPLTSTAPFTASGK